jgi:UDP-N-acetylglucosamine transferase subunit ALG13
MNTKINNLSEGRIKVLIAPLDWGLGHATRCVPIIKELLNQKCEVWVAASSAQRRLLKEEFPFLLFVELPGYGIKYGKNRAFTIIRLLFSIPKILIRIKREKAWLSAFHVAEQPDVVISDNRYGLNCPGLLSVFITHQLNILTPFGPQGDRWLQRINYRAIRSFSRCWIPDIQGEGSLAGRLSHPDRLPAVTTRYIGWLSRLERTEEGSGLQRVEGDEQGSIVAADSLRLLVLLSGPEPQRTILEDMILRQAGSCGCQITLVRGLPGGALKLRGERQEKATPSNMITHDHLPAKALNAVIAQADLVLSRAGYSTIMDLFKMGKKAVLIPTPGQTEQEYLGRYLMDQRLALSVTQSEFSLSGAIEAARTFPFNHARIAKTDELLRQEIRSLLDQVRRV